MFPDCTKQYAKKFIYYMKQMSLGYSMVGKFSWKILVPGVPVTTSVGFLGLSNVSLIETEGHYIIFDTGHYGIRD